MRTFVVIVVLALATLASTPAAAQTDDPQTIATARALFQEGVALARSGDYRAASDRFRRSQVLHPAPAVAFNLASALVHDGELVEASEILAQLLRDSTIPEPVRTSGESLRDQIAPRLARLTVRLSGDASETRVELDTIELPEAAIGVPVPADPGAHEVRVLRDEREVAHEHVELAEGERRELVLAVPERDIAAPEVPRAAIEIDLPSAAPPAAGGDDGVWIGLGVGIGVLAVGAIVTTAVILTMPSGGTTAVTGNAMPGILTW